MVAYGEALVCPRCRAEYLVGVLECADCGTQLVSEHGLERVGYEEIPPVSALSCVRAASVGWARGLSLQLSQAGIPHRLEAVSEEGQEENVRGEPDALLPYGVWVLEADLLAAREVDENFLRSQIPDLPEDLGAAEMTGDDACPACGTAVAPEVQECPDCGLVLIIGDG